jgi:DNA-directed RNA polymerase beta' subunit
VRNADHELCLQVLRWPPDRPFERLTFTLASPEAIRARAPKVVTQPGTLDFRTLLPQPGGLFDYKVFGAGTVIDAPAIADDEPWKPRNTNFGRLVLARPIVHPLVALHAPEEIAARTGLSRDELHRARHGDDPDARRAVVDRLDGSEHGRALVLRELPVIPPDLRPLVRLADDRWQSSPINELYGRAIERNLRLAKLVEQASPAAVVEQETRALETALLALFDNELQDDPIRDRDGRAMTSLRGLCGGTGGCTVALRDLDARAADEPSPLTARLHRIDAITFGLGIELRRGGA